MSVLDLKPDPQDTTAFYLENIYQILAEPNVSRSSIPSTLAKPPPFSPPNYAIWVNSLWFLSLVISLTCAMLATLLQQWARRYLRITQPPRYNPHDRARVREFFAYGVDRLHLAWAVEALPALVHLSLFLFFAGLLIYLFNVSHMVFRAVVWWIAISAAAYLFITITPIFWLNSPYYAPLSSPACRACAGVLYAVLQIPPFFGSYRFFHLMNYYREWIFQGREKITKKIVRGSSEEIDRRILQWTFDTLSQSYELDRFFQCILGLLSSNVVKEPRLFLVRLCGRRLPSAIMEFLGRTWASNLISEPDKIQRLIVCMKVADALSLPNAAWGILERVFNGSQHIVLQSVEAGYYLTRRGNTGNQEIGSCAPLIVAGVIANVRERNDRWMALVEDQLGAYLPCFPECSHDSVLLKNLIRTTEQIFNLRHNMRYLISSLILGSLSKFNVRDALPELQHDFCALWNAMVQEAQARGSSSLPIYILIGIRRIYIDLHQGTDAAPTKFTAATNDRDDILQRPSSYLLCDLQDHRSPAHEVVDRDVAMGATAHNPATTTTDFLVTSGRTILSVHGDTQNSNIFTHPELVHHPSQSEPLTSNLVPTILRLENRDPSENPV